jgi:tRNA_anti-like
MEKRITYGISLILLLTIALGLYCWLRHSPDDPFAGIKPADVHIAARDLVSIFTKNESLADREYLYKTLSVRGVIKAIKKDGTGSYMVYLTAGPEWPACVSCSLDSLYTHQSFTLRVGDSTILRGICAGRLMDVVLLQCIIEK